MWTGDGLDAGTESGTGLEESDEAETEVERCEGRFGLE
jgi:hypothetical protein